MIERNMKNTAERSNVLQMNLKDKESCNLINVHWKCVDKIFKNGELIDVIEGSNIVVDDCSILLAGLMGGKIANGAQYWAIGSGSQSWDSQWSSNPPTPVKESNKLVSEIFRKKIESSDISYVDHQGGESLVPTNSIKISVSIGEDEGNGDWREFGLFGGTATATKNSGIMIDHKYHKILSKTSEISVERSIILEF